MGPYDTLLYEEHEGVASVTLNRPDVLNAFNVAMQRELHDVWRSLRRRDEVRAVVLSGAGDKAFCAGIDRLEAMGDGAADRGAIAPRSTPFMLDEPGQLIGS